MFISDALAQTTDAAASQGSVTGMFIQLALIFLIFYGGPDFEVWIPR